MDSLTQVVLGAAVGYAVGGRQLGKTAFLLGAVAGTLPDLDFVPTLPFDDPLIYLKHHRGVSHSLLFSVLAPLGIAWLIRRWKPNGSFGALYGVFFWGFLTHIILDCFTTWGTQVFWPLPYRVAWNTVFIIDPLYTLPLLISLLVALALKCADRARRWVWAGLVLSSLYLAWSVGVKVVLNERFEALFHHHDLPVVRYTTRPTPFNTVLWSATAETEDGYYYGMVSIFDAGFQGPLYFVPKGHELMDGIQTDDRIQGLLSYTKGYYTVESADDGLMLRDLRYGFLGDPWINGPGYVFSYFISRDSDGRLGVTIHNPRPDNPGALLGQVWERIVRPI